MGRRNSEQRKFRLALGYFFRAKKTSRTNWQSVLAQRITGNISEAYSKLGQLDSANSVVTTQFWLLFFHYFLVLVLEFIAAIFSGERPVDFGGDGISVGLSDQGFFFELLRAANASVQALTRKSRELDIGPVEPGVVFGGEVKRELVAQLPDPSNGQVLVKSAVGVGAVVVLYQLDGGHIRVMGGNHPVHESSVVSLGFGGRDSQMALAGIDVVRQQHVANILSQVILVFFAGRPWFGRNRAQHLVEQLAGPLVEAQARDARIGRLRVQSQHVF